MDQVTEKDRLLITRLGIDWMGSSISRSSSARRILLVGMKGSHNFFTIFLPKKAVREPERSREGLLPCGCLYVYMCVCLCVCVCVCVCQVHNARFSVTHSMHKFS